MQQGIQTQHSLAAAHGMAVVVVNQMTTRMGERGGVVVAVEQKDRIISALHQERALLGQLAMLQVRCSTAPPWPRSCLP